MGGFGSGNRYGWRGSKKTTVEDCRQLDANRLMREGILRPGVRLTGGWRWFHADDPNNTTSSISYEVATHVEPPWVRLHYTFTASGEKVDYRVFLTTTQPRFGGLRWWFLCPLSVNGVACGRRVGKLFLLPQGRYFGCRHCLDLTYTSCQESHHFDSLYRFMALQNGWDFETTKEAMKGLGRRWNGRD